MNIVDENSNMIPNFTHPSKAALWIRQNGNKPLTNQTFHGLLADLVGGASREQANIVRVLTRPGISHLSSIAPSKGFITQEEFNDLLDHLKSHPRSLNLSYQITERGTFVEFYD